VIESFSQERATGLQVGCLSLELAVLIEDACEVIKVREDRLAYDYCIHVRWTFDSGIVGPNAELTGRQRLDALPARCRIGTRRLAGKVASRWRSG
jgi:hypothetical protein